jgi:hypothetical protein
MAAGRRVESDADAVALDVAALGAVVACCAPAQATTPASATESRRPFVKLVPLTDDSPPPS